MEGTNGLPTDVEVRPIPGWPGYAAGADGSVWSCRHRRHCTGIPGSITVFSESWRQLNPQKLRKGYLGVGLYRDGKAHRRKVHVLVLTAFVGQRPPGMDGCHNNDDPNDNRIENLRWDTRAANIADKVRDRRHAFGERVGSAKITENQARQIIERLVTGEPGLRVAAHLNVSKWIVWGIARGLTWKHLPRPAAA